MPLIIWTRIIEVEMEKDCVIWHVGDKCLVLTATHVETALSNWKEFLSSFIMGTNLLMTVVSNCIAKE